MRLDGAVYANNAPLAQGRPTPLGGLFFSLGGLCRADEGTEQ